MKGLHKLKLGYLILCIVRGTASTCLAHNEPLHMAMTASAANSSSGLAAFLTDNFVISDSQFFTDPKLIFSPIPSYWVVDPTGYGPKGWMMWGAYWEDALPRPVNHFYIPWPRPVQEAGLVDNTESPFGILPHNVNSFIWATQGNGNIETWSFARSYEYTALTSANLSDRNANFAHLFYALGRILHLNQDLSQPDHVRDDEHLIRSHRWIENFGSEVYDKEANAYPQMPHGWSYWQNQGFQKLEDFWDRHHYNGDAAALNDDKSTDFNVIPNFKLGLAEFCNGNFLGEDAIYGEYFTRGTYEFSLHYFPFPSRDTSTQYKSSWQNPLTSIDGSTLADGSGIKRVYLHKTGDGIQFQHHSVLGYMDVVAMTYSTPSLSLQRTIHTPFIKDNSVLQDYHSILIPKAIEYSAGILDYFFRGQLEADVSWDNVAKKFDLKVVNNSGQALSGGTFQLFFDDPDVNRQPVPGADFGQYQSGLNAGYSFQATFSPPQDNTGEYTAIKYTLVYQGIIGTDGANPLDSVDGGNAVAARSFTAGAITTPSPLPDGTEYQAYLQQQLQQVGLNDPVWSVVAGEGTGLPGGLTISASGVISGTPTATGPWSFTIQAQDGVQKVTKDFNLTILTPCFQNNPKLPDATQDQSYSATFTPYPSGTYSFAMVGTIPGMSLNSGSGVLQGTPTTSGDYSFTIQLIDGVTQIEACEENFTLHVTSACPDWDTVLMWGPGHGDFVRGTISPINKASASFSASITSDQPTDFVSNEGSFNYNGPACCANLHVDVTSANGGRDSGCSVTVDVGTTEVGGVFYNDPVGSYDLPFSLPDSHGTPYNITINVQAEVSPFPGDPGEYTASFNAQVTTVSCPP